MCPVIHNTYIRWSLPHGKLWVVLHQWNTIQKPKLINNNWRAYRCFRKRIKSLCKMLCVPHRWPQSGRRHAFSSFQECRPWWKGAAPPTQGMPPFPENSLFPMAGLCCYMGIQTPLASNWDNSEELFQFKGSPGDSLRSSLKLWWTS